MPSGLYGEINVKNFGAFGDGVTDDTAVIQAAINDLKQNNGGILFFPPGIYMISASLSMAGNSNITFRGSGITCTQIARVTGFSGATFSTLANVVRVRDMNLPDFSIGGLNTPAPGIPATTVPLTNPFPFDVQVFIIAGTVTVIAINGQATGLTSNASGVTVTLKAGQSITLTYSVVPTSWVWFGVGG